MMFRNSSTFFSNTLWYQFYHFRDILYKSNVFLIHGKISVPYQFVLLRKPVESQCQKKDRVLWNLYLDLNGSNLWSGTSIDFHTNIEFRKYSFTFLTNSSCFGCAHLRNTCERFVNYKFVYDVFYCFLY